MVQAKAGARQWPVWLLPAIDLAGVNIAFAVAYWLRYRLEIGGDVSQGNFVTYHEYAPWGLALSGLLLVIYSLEGLYSRRRRLSWPETWYSLASGTLVGVVLLSATIFGLRPPAQSRLMLTYAAVAIVLLLWLVRTLAEMWRRRIGQGVSRTLIVGAGEIGRAVMGRIVAEKAPDYQVVGFLDDDPAKRTQALGRFNPLGATADLVAVLAREAVDTVIITLPWQSRDKIMRLVAQCEARGVNVRIVPDLFQMSLNEVDLDSLHGIPLIAVREPTIQGWHYRLKRAIDVCLAALTLVLLAPLLALIALAIRLDSVGPVLFGQTRVGRDGWLFTCYKFRSMIDGADHFRSALQERNEATGPIFKMKDDPRLTRVGRVIRRLSLDELPQFWNVLVGDMSLVGPRPPLPTEVQDYQDWHRRRLEIAPGITGLWQVSGRSELTFDEMVMLDLFYAENWSLLLDFQILLRTLPTVLRGTGAY